MTRPGVGDFARPTGQLLPTADGAGWALATEVLFNHKQQCSKVLGNPDQLATYLERKDDKLSYTMAESLQALVQAKRVNKLDAIRAMVGNGQAAFAEKIKQL